MQSSQSNIFRSLPTVPLAGPRASGRYQPVCAARNSRATVATDAVHLFLGRKGHLRHMFVAAPDRVADRECNLKAVAAGQTLVIKTPPALDFTSYRNFRASYEQAPACTDCYVVDLSGTDTIDSSGLAMLLLLRDHAGGNRDRVHLAQASPALRSVLRTVNFDCLFTLDT